LSAAKATFRIGLGDGDVGLLSLCESKVMLNSRWAELQSNG